ncbi:cell adhesion molecule CEACAM1 [Equus caballus]|nr:carcinoembryonic antigen-related cell adhesion molecule 1 [Equus caballus]XP_008541088.1 PREDICTED: carcinoembryonic antigen-related cell adhesion molecule 1-like [Equus przewalskii]
MQSLSAPAHRQNVPWQGLLLAVSILTFWNSLTTAKVTIVSVPPKVTPGENVTLVVQNLPRNVIGYTWYKGYGPARKQKIAYYDTNRKVMTPGPAFTGRETVYPNGSMLFQKVTVEYTGNYTVFVIKRRLRYEVAIGQLHVYWKPVSKPSIRVTIIHKNAR